VRHQFDKFEPRPVTEEKAPNINIITRGGTRTGVDVDNSTQRKIHKVVPEDVKYDPLVQKQFFKDVVEIFRWISNPAIPDACRLKP
jgi:hypothetical protein